MASPRALTLVLLFIAALLVPSCKSRPQLEDPEQWGVILGVSSEYTEPTVYERNFGLHARGEGPLVYISAHNQSQAEIVVDPRLDLALILGPNKDTDLVRISPGTADLSRFPAMILKPGERGCQAFRLTHLDSADGKRLVYQNPRQALIFYVTVE